MRTEEGLGESQERYRQLVENLNDVIFMTDTSGRVTYVSPVIERLSGYEAAEVLGRPFTEFVDPGDLEAVSSSFQRTLQGTLEPLEFRVVAKDGTARWVRTSSQPILAPEGLIGLRGVLTDITDRKRAEATVAEHERHFRALIEHSSDIISLIGADGTFTYFGPSVTRILGYAPEELIGQAVLGIVHPDDLPEAMEKYAELVGHPGSTATGTSRCRHKDGSWRWLEGVGTNLLAEPTFQAIIVNSRDVTDRMRAAEELRRSEERLRTIFEEGPLGIVIVGVDLRFLEVNSTFCRITGYSRDELIGRTFAEITYPDDREDDVQQVRRVFRGDIPYIQREKRYLRSDGSTVWGSVTVSVIRDDEDAPLYAIAMVRDISARKHAEAEAQERLTELAHVLRVATVNEMTAMLAHELNQPLAAIINYARGCARRLHAGVLPLDELAHAQDHIVEEAMRAAQVIRRLRQLLRKETPRREIVDLNDTVRGVLGLVDGEARAHRVAVRLDLSAGLPPVHADRVQIEQVILNLVRNGFEAMDGTDHVEQNVLYVRTQLATPELTQVTVCDTGIGLNPADADRLFAPFFTTKPSGLGMGLSISRLIVEAHGGRLWAVPAAQRGATFRFTLPACREQEQRVID